MTTTRIIDALGTHCPVPVTLLAAAIARASGPAVFQILADDPLVAIDIPAWCHSHGHELLSCTEVHGQWTALVAFTPGLSSADSPIRA
jgi:cysteine desulfurase